MKILIAEDKEEIANLVDLFMKKEGFETDIACNGQEAYDYLLQNTVDLCIFDIMMPKMDGITLIQNVRKFSDVPVIFLTAKNLEQDKVLGLDFGADDYVTKPFSSLELVSRVKALLRRSKGLEKSAEIQKYGEITVDKAKCAVFKNDKSCDLTTTEYKLFLKFLSEPERVFTKEQLGLAINDSFFESDENTITVHISNLRDKIEDNPKTPKYIKTIRGLGYKLEKN